MLRYRLSAMMTLIDALRKQGRGAEACAATEEALAILGQRGGAGYPKCRCASR